MFPGFTGNHKCQVMMVSEEVMEVRGNGCSIAPEVQTVEQLPQPFHQFYSLAIVHLLKY